VRGGLPPRRPGRTGGHRRPETRVQRVRRRQAGAARGRAADGQARRRGRRRPGRPDRDGGAAEAGPRGNSSRRAAEARRRPAQLCAVVPPAA
jgi:hypothetical protein